MRVSEIAKFVDGIVEGNSELEISGLAKIEEATYGHLTFLANPRYKKHIRSTSASAILVARDMQIAEAIQGRSSQITIIRVDNPYVAFLRLLEHFHPSRPELPPGIHPTSIIATGALIGKDVAVGAFAVIGENAVIGDRTVVSHGVIVGSNVRIGGDCLIYPNVTIREECTIGERCIIHSGTVIGSDGFGFAPTPNGSFEKIPQRGIVAIENDVEIGANCTIDRATLGETRIRRGVKIDNLVQVAHNVEIGEDTVIAGQSGISGSTKLGKGCMIGGQVGFAGHLEIADNTQFGAQSGVGRSIKEPGKKYFGTPAHELPRSLRIEGVIRQLPELLTEIRSLQQRIQELESRLGERMNNLT